MVVIGFLESVSVSDHRQTVVVPKVSTSGSNTVSSTANPEPATRRSR
jgi:hypothetical protein